MPVAVTDDVVVMLQIIDDWRYIAMVIDRLQLFIFLAVTIGGTIGILIDAPHIFEFIDQQDRIAKIMGSSSDTSSYWHA